MQHSKPVRTSWYCSCRQQLARSEMESSSYNSISEMVVEKKMMMMMTMQPRGRWRMRRSRGSSVLENGCAMMSLMMRTEPYFEDLRGTIKLAERKRRAIALALALEESNEREKLSLLFFFFFSPNSLDSLLIKRFLKLSRGFYIDTRSTADKNVQYYIIYGPVSLVSCESSWQWRIFLN